MNNIINLNRYRKMKARTDKDKTADINRAKHGRTKEEKTRDKNAEDQRERLLDDHKRDDDEA